MVLFKAGAHVPVKPSLEVVGSGVNVAPEHMGATGLNVGVGMLAGCVIVAVAVLTHPLVSVTVTV